MNKKRKKRVKKVLTWCTYLAGEPRGQPHVHAMHFRLAVAMKSRSRWVLAPANMTVKSIVHFVLLSSLRFVI